MRVLLADDAAALRHGLGVQLQRWGYEPIVCVDTTEARAILQGDDPPPLAILDWSMPGADGVTLCREVRATPSLTATYVVLLTARDTRDEMVAGLDGGADEYNIKPFDWAVLRARVNTGARIAMVQQSLAQRVQELQLALDMVNKLSGLLQICSYCKRIRKEENRWQQLETYLSEHLEAQFSHSVCPDCYELARKDFER